KYSSIRGNDSKYEGHLSRFLLQFVLHSLFHGQLSRFSTFFVRHSLYLGQLSRFPLQFVRHNLYLGQFPTGDTFFCPSQPLSRTIPNENKLFCPTHPLSWTLIQGFRSTLSISISKNLSQSNPKTTVYGTCLLYLYAHTYVHQSNRVVLGLSSLISFPNDSYHNKQSHLQKLVPQYHVSQQ